MSLKNGLIRQIHTGSAVLVSAKRLCCYALSKGYISNHDYYLSGSLHLHRSPLHSPQPGEESISSGDRLEGGTEYIQFSTYTIKSMALTYSMKTFALRGGICERVIAIRKKKNKSIFYYLWQFIAHEPAKVDAATLFFGVLLWRSLLTMLETSSAVAFVKRASMWRKGQWIRCVIFII